MPMHALLPLATYPDANAEPVVRNAASFCHLAGAQLHAIALIVDIPPVSSALGRALVDVPAMIRDAEALSHRHAEQLLSKLAAEAKARGVALTTEDVPAATAFLGEAAAEHARYYDLALLGWEAENHTSRMVAEAVIFGSGRPAVLLPEFKSVESLRRIVVAWDGSRVAARALADSGFLLERAESVEVVTVVDEKPLADKEIAERLAAVLRTRGIKAHGRSILSEDCPIAETLQEHALGSDGDLLVMGGYGHSRVRQFILGGATQGVLGDLRLPVLLSH